jgi:hypothetical protein
MPNRVVGRTMALAIVTPVLAFAANCQPQFPRGEVFAGFSYANVTLGSQSGLFAPAGPSYYGAQLSAKFNLGKNVGLLFDWGEQSGASTIADSFGYETHMQLEATQVLAGPEFTLRTRKFNAFAHTLVGLTHTSLNQETSLACGNPGYPGLVPCYQSIARRTNLALSVGGGLDRNWKKHFAIRLLEADYIPTRLSGKWEGHFRVGTGILVKL